VKSENASVTLSDRADGALSVAETKKCALMLMICAMKNIDFVMII
jgi:hypothetical protein